MNEQQTNFSEANRPTDRIKDYGKKSLTPLLSLIQKYHTEIDPYFNAIVKGIEAGRQALHQENASSEEKYVGEWFNEASSWFNDVRQKLNSKNLDDVLQYLDLNARHHPGMTFSTSYLAGLFLGRIGRHLSKDKSSESIH